MQRILKRKMTTQNMFQIVNDDINHSIVHFIYDIVDRPIRSSPSIGYFYYWKFLSSILDKNNSLSCDIPECILHNLITLFINDYNNYYLDDNYYHIEWFDSICYINFLQDIRKEKKLEIEKYRHEVFDEISRYYHEIQ
jgi:hypothetical protein